MRLPMLDEGVYSSLVICHAACRFATLTWKAATEKKFRIAT
ncbi:hypothetical protein USDA257_c42690 [Sinorhizobium fredii USDA 257]|uniref:Uncharacterized protein n=1 Tax=Sinorhizobium fredii (strain USDA 257) TaxID=1185652 RepID=I3XAA2_SINF2|nr:hypothetical protein USDA257_c42690 [Sinorhizobium fredii USDA 257]